MSDVQRAARVAAVMKAISDLAADAFKRSKADVAQHLDPGDRKGAALDDGTKIGTISYSEGRKGAKVYAETAFYDYVAKHYPGEIVSVVRPSFVKTLFATGTEVDDELCDPKTGEMVPGVRVERGDPYVSVRQDDDAVRAIARAWQRGELPFLLDTLALPAFVSEEYDPAGKITEADGRVGPHAD